MPRMRKEEIFSLVAQAVVSHFGTIQTVTRETTAFDVDGWDSLAHFVFVVKLEKMFAIRADDRLRHDCANVGELADVVALLVETR